MDLDRIYVEVDHHPVPMQNHKGSILKVLRDRELSARNLEPIHGNPWAGAEVPIPERFRLPMETILPQHALEMGHIFLGFTSCGQYLLSYTYKVVSGEVGSDGLAIALAPEDSDLFQDYFYQYKLYFWLFVPGQSLRKVWSLVLFQEIGGVPDNNLIIEIMDYGTGDLIISGRSGAPERGGSNALLYLTITSVPSSRFPVPFAFHSIVYRCPPFPPIIPGIQFLSPRTLVLNSGNAFHVLTFNPESKHQDQQPVKPRHRLQISFWLKNEDPDCIRTLFHDHRRININPYPQTLRQHEDCILYQEKFLQLVPSPMSLLSIVEETQSLKKNRRRPSSICSYDSEYSQISSSLLSDCSQSTESDSTTATDKDKPKSPISASTNVNCNSQALSPARSSPLKLNANVKSERKFFKSMSWRRSNSSSNSSSSLETSRHNTSQPPPSDCYEVFDEENIVQDTLSSFRKRRHAEKEYQFTEDSDFNEENNLLVTLPRFQMRNAARSAGNRLGGGLGIGMRRGSPRRNCNCTEESESPLRPLNVNVAELELLNSNRNFVDRELIVSPASCPAPTPAISSTWAQTPTFASLTMGNCIVRSRKAGSSATVTAVNDEDYNLYGLNVEIPNGIQGNQSLSVDLTALDLEVFCHEVMELICQATGFAYCSYSDYDIAILGVDEKNGGSVTGLACVLAQAEDSKNPCGGGDPRRNYEVTFSFVWEPWANSCRLLYLGNLKEIGNLANLQERWNPTRSIQIHLLQEMFPDAASSLSKDIAQSHPTFPRILSNETAVFECKSWREMGDGRGLWTIYRSQPSPPHEYS